MLKIIYSDFVKKDLSDISSFISQDNPFYATKVVSHIISNIEILVTFPLLGKERKGGLRELVDPKYGFRIIYVITSKFIIILSVFKYKGI